MNIWKISNADNSLPTLYFCAESYDEALKKARKIDKNYTTGEVCTKEDIMT